MTHSCTDVYYHSRHTALILFLFIFSYIYSLYQCYLFCQPLYEYRRKKASYLIISDLEFVHLIFFTLGFTMTTAIDYYLIRPSFAVCLMIILYYSYERISAKFNILLIIALDFIGIGIIYILQAACFVKTLVILRILFEALRLFLTMWSNNFLRNYKSGGITLVGLCILISWVIFFLLKR